MTRIDPIEYLLNLPWWPSYPTSRKRGHLRSQIRYYQELVEMLEKHVAGECPNCQLTDVQIQNNRDSIRSAEELKHRFEELLSAMGEG